jgi:hypothetical protein
MLTYYALPKNSLNKKAMAMTLRRIPTTYCTFSYFIPPQPIEKGIDDRKGVITGCESLDLRR